MLKNADKTDDWAIHQVSKVRFTKLEVGQAMRRGAKPIARFPVNPEKRYCN
jgi:hypothetical protein